MTDKQEVRMTGFEPRDIYIKLEISLNALGNLITFLDNSSVPYSEEKKEAIDFVKDQFFPYIESIHKEFTDGRNS